MFDCDVILLDQLDDSYAYDPSTTLRFQERRKFKFKLYPDIGYDFMQRKTITRSPDLGHESCLLK